MDIGHIELALAIGCRNPEMGPYRTARAFARLIDCARRHQKLCEALCNGAPEHLRHGAAVEAWEDKIYADLDRTEAALAEIGLELGIRIEVQRDPRGATVIVDTSTGAGQSRMQGVPL